MLELHCIENYFTFKGLNNIVLTVLNVLNVTVLKLTVLNVIKPFEIFKN